MPRTNPSHHHLAVGIVAVVALALVVGLVWGFGQQIARARQIQMEEDQLEQVVMTKQAYHDELVEQLEYVQSDEYVEQWAREEAKMVRPGEVIVVVPESLEEEPEEETSSIVADESESRPFWVEWWELIFTPSD